MKKKFKLALEQIFTVDDTPHRIGVAFAIGTFIAMSALMGLHTILGLAIPQSLGLSKRVTMAGVFVNNPWTMVPIYGFCLWVGVIVTGSPGIPHDMDWANISAGSLLEDLAYLLWPFVIGTTLVGVVSAITGYYLIKHAVIKYRSSGKARA